MVNQLKQNSFVVPKKWFKKYGSETMGSVHKKWFTSTLIGQVVAVVHIVCNCLNKTYMRVEVLQCYVSGGLVMVFEAKFYN